MLFALAVAALVLVPVAVTFSSFARVEGDILAHLTEFVLPELVGNTLWLVLGVAIGVGVLGVSLAWLTAMCEFPGRRLFDWALLLPLGSAAVRGVVPPIAKLGLEIWPSPLWACLIGYIMSSLVVLTVQRVRKGSFAVQAPRSGRFWFALTGISNGLSALTLFAAVRNGPITLVAPLVAIYPLVTVGLSAMMLKHVAITPRIIVGTLLTVAGVALVLAG